MIEAKLEMRNYCSSGLDSASFFGFVFSVLVVATLKLRQLTCEGGGEKHKHRRNGTELI